jgi:uncharacterized protein YbjT (DUF2867 family)
MNGIAAAATEGNAVRLPPALIQPMAADDVAGALARLAVGAPRNGMIEIAGPEQFRLDELTRRLRKADDDSREVITDPQARFFGIAPSERTLLPADDAHLGQTDFDNWIRDRTAGQRTDAAPRDSPRANRVVVTHWNPPAAKDGGPSNDES